MVGDRQSHSDRLTAVLPRIIYQSRQNRAQRRAFMSFHPNRPLQPVSPQGQHGHFLCPPPQAANPKNFKIPSSQRAVFESRRGAAVRWARSDGPGRRAGGVGGSAPGPSDLAIRCPRPRAHYKGRLLSKAAPSRSPICTPTPPSSLLSSSAAAPLLASPR